MPTTEQTTPATRARMSPRRRAQLLRWVQYAVLAIVLLVAVFAANWHQIIDVFFRGNLVVETLTTSLGTAFKNTLVYTAGAFAFGLVVGTVLALMRLSSIAPYRWIAGIYIEFFRGLPAIVVLHRVQPAAAGLPGHGRSRWTPTARSGSRSASSPAPTWPRPSGPASRPSPRASSRRPGRWACRPAGRCAAIVLPQAFRIILPPLTNELILLVKDSSLVYILGLSTERVRADQVRPRPGEHQRQPHPAGGRRPLLPA